MKIFIKGECAYVPFSKKVEREFGTRRGGKIILHPIEVTYIVLNRDGVVVGDGEMGLKDVIDWCMERVKRFTSMYCVYEDLKGKGYRVRFLDDYIVGNLVFYPIEEHDEIKIGELTKLERFVLSIVDDENEVTYYSVEEVDPVGRNVEDFKAEGVLIGNRIVTDESIHKRYFYGSLKGEKTFLSIIEGAYLVEKDRLKVYKGLEVLKFEDLIEIGRMMDSRFERRFEVYRDLKDRGFVVKTGLKFGSDFRLYESLEDSHSRYLVTIVDDRPLKAFEIVRAVRLANSVKKSMIFVYKDGRNRYVKFERIKV